MKTLVDSINAYKQFLENEKIVVETKASQQRYIGPFARVT
jgi:hypothetical protein